MYDMVTKHIHYVMDTNVGNMSFTTVVRTSDVSPVSMFSITVQWLGEDFHMERAFLHAEDFSGSYTAQGLENGLRTHYTACRT